MADRSVPDDMVPFRAGVLPPGAEAMAELERERGRDPEALATFFERYFDRVYALAYRLLGDGERERLVQEALRPLPEPLRLAVVMHDYQGLGHDEIALLTGVNHAAARKRYSRALAALARRLKDSLG